MNKLGLEYGITSALYYKRKRNCRNSHYQIPVVTLIITKVYFEILVNNVHIFMWSCDRHINPLGLC